jgi:hypothetical protein
MSRIVRMFAMCDMHAVRTSTTGCKTLVTAAVLLCISTTLQLCTMCCDMFRFTCML